MTPEFWVAVGQIIMIDILLGGDNAVVIALACRKLPAHQRTRGILWGTAGAIVLRVVLIYFALTLLAIPFLKLVGAALLVWIGVKLLAPDPDDAHGNIDASDKLLAFATAGDYRTPSCPRCGAKMRAVKGRGGKADFWGCQRYPACRQRLGMRRAG